MGWHTPNVCQNRGNYMTIKELKNLIEKLPDETLVMRKISYDYVEVKDWTFTNLEVKMIDGRQVGHMIDGNTELCFVI
jgi:hypothetical protein